MTNPSIQLIKPNRLAELLAASKSKTARQNSQNLTSPTIPASPIVSESKISQAIQSLQDEAASIGMSGEAITLNSDQLAFVKLATSGKSCILLGAAGTGKTTTMRAVAQSLIQSPEMTILQGSSHKYLRDNIPGIIFTAYTRRATANIRKNLPTGIKDNAITIHKLLEYQPVYYEVFDEESGNTKSTMAFEATRTCVRPLPDTIHTIVIEESSMVSTDLFKQIQDACQHAVQFIFLGDIQQLPPVFGPAILGYKMLELPTIELTQVYRQALESPIIRLAHRILSGNPIPATAYDDWHTPGQLKLHPWKKKLHPDIALATIQKFLTNTYDSGGYNPETDIILCPFNKSLGTTEMNKSLANHRARSQNLETWEIIAGFNKCYFSVGDKVLYAKEDAYITRIVPNPTYTGVWAQPESTTLDYWGHNFGTAESQSEDAESQADFLLSQVSAESEERVRKASHIVYIKRDPNDAEETETKLETASDLNALDLGYCITVHKSQGSEWNKVFLILHESHATMIQRELLYTAVTRAKKELYVICEPNTFTKGILNQRIKGDTLAAKSEYFKGRLEAAGGVY